MQRHGDRFMLLFHFDLSLPTVARIIQSLLNNRRFLVEMNTKQSRWRLQRNGLLQGSVLAPMLVSIYTNDQPQFQNIRRSIYADGLCIVTQFKSFEIIESRLTCALQSISAYYEHWVLNANPEKCRSAHFNSITNKYIETLKPNGKIRYSITSIQYI